MAIPNQEEHKVIINKNLKLINRLVSISIFILVLILIFKHTTIIDKIFIYVFLLMQAIIIWVCNIEWNQPIMIFVHYLYCLIVYLSMFSNNIYILMYFIILLLLNVYIWYINDDSCIFGGLDWGNEKVEYWGDYIFRFIPILIFSKVIYLFNNSNIKPDIINIMPLNEINQCQDGSQMLNKTISFEELHNTITKTIKIE